MSLFTKLFGWMFTTKKKKRRNSISSLEGQPMGAGSKKDKSKWKTGYSPVWTQSKSKTQSQLQSAVETPEEAGIAAALAIAVASSQASTKTPAKSKSCCACAKYFCVGVLGVVVAIAVISSILLWFTSFFEDAIHKGLVLREGSTMLENWRRPAVRPYLKVRVYNYTNVQRFLDGLDEKLTVQEVGPYVYRETLERMKVKMNPNGTISYSEKRTHIFLPNLSKGKEDDTLFVPNLPLIGAISKVRDESFFTRMTLSGILWGVAVKPFNKLLARDFFFGYENSLYSLAKGYADFMQNKAMPKLGLLAARSGISNDTYTIFNGVEDYSLLDVVSRHNGRAALTAWDDPKCNRIDGTEGTFFPLDLLTLKKSVHLFNAGICRRLPLEFKEDVVLFGNIPALRYGPSDTVFHNTTANACYRKPDFAHLPDGVFDNSACAHGSPILLSFPRFYKGSPKLREYVDGIPEPKKEEVEFSFYIHPVLGMNMGAVSRMQMNIMIRTASQVDYLGNLKDGDILPIAWIETNATDFPEDTKAALYHATYTVRTVERGLMYALPVLGIIAAISALWIIIPCKPPKEEYQQELDSMLKS